MKWNYENEQWTQLPAHLKHLPLFTRHLDYTSWVFRLLWAGFLKFTFHFYIRLVVRGNFREALEQNPRLLIISNHSSHLDAVSIAAAIPVAFWSHLYISAAKDYWFSNPVFTFFSKHCLGAIPIDRKDKSGEAIRLCTTLLEKLDQIWMILFPEGTRSKDGFIHDFKRGVSLFSEKTNTPVLFLFIEGNTNLMPKGALIPRPGKLLIHVGPVHPPAPIQQLNSSYKKWVLSINPHAYRPEEKST